MLETGLAGKCALLTGGASGIGQSIAVGLAGEGVHVRVLDKEDAEATLERVQAVGGSASRQVVDVRDEGQLERAVDAAIVELGGIDLFVNVAAIFGAASITRLSTQMWNSILETNVTACVVASRRVAANMVTRGTGSMLIVGSTVTCAPSYAGAAYRASKVALRSFMETLAVELAPFDIRVNMLTPGPFPTGLVSDLPAEQRRAAAREVPLGQREGLLEEVRGAALFLLSSHLAPFTTGTEVFVDGGLHLRPLYIGPLETVRGLNEL